jgi:5-methylcytosine-specific restriction protein A
VSNTTLNLKLYQIPDEAEEKDYIFKEGKVLYKLHKYHERDTKLILFKKNNHLKKYGSLDCEACTFNFQVKYGDLGFGYIECHHKTPLSQYENVQKTTLDDLALVCSNCHRMLHRQLDVMNVEKLKFLIQ